ncbi:MAG: ABC transporter ATP-binding protein [Oscillospiraceae bacterium]|nr:ABC transporter ATP-binding protein [Oscillospiraceae bacterium]
MFKLLKYMGSYKKETVLAPLFKMLEAFFELLVPLVMAAIIDVGIKNNDLGYIVRLCLLMAALGLIGLSCSITAQFFAARAAVGFVAKLRHALLKHVQCLSYTELDTLGSDRLITGMTSDINQVQNGVNLVLRLFLRSPVVVFGAMIMAFTIDVPSAMVFAVTIPALSVVVFGIMLVSIPLYKKVQAALDKVLGSVREALGGVRVIRAFDLEDSEIKNFNEKNETHTALQQFTGRISGLMNPVTYVIVNLATVALIYRGALRVDAGSITQGELVALVNYMSQILIELIKLANLIITVTRAIACGNRVQAVFETESSMPNLKSEIPEPKGEYSVEFLDASLTYKNAGAEALSGVTFKVRRGQTVGIIGGTGSGKSTLVNLIPRFYDATRGRVYIDGSDVRDYPLTALREKIGVVPQRAVLFKGTIRSNLLWGNEDADEESLREALELAQATDVAASKEEGLDAEVEQNGRNFSGGQRQRLTIARALVKKPEILILDDSASALDYATEARLRKSLRSLGNDPTVFIVSQRTSSIQHADIIVVLDDGAAVGIGTHEELLKSCEVYREIHSSQFGKGAAV